MADRPTNTIVGQINNGFLARMMRYSPPAVVVWLALANRADKAGRCHPSFDTLQEDTGVARATVKDALAALEAAGEIEIDHGNGVGNQYMILTSSAGELLPVQEMNRTSSADEPLPVQQMNSNHTQRTKHKNQLRGKAAVPTDERLEKEQTLIEKWNALEGVRKNQVDHLTASRRKSFRTRLKAKGWWDNALSAMAKFPLKCFNEPDGWRPDMEWFLKPDSVTKILEGKYDWTKDGPLGNGSAKPQEPLKYRDQA